MFKRLRGERIFVTGGTGFFGSWLLESFAWANDQMDLKAEAVVLTRDPGAFLKRAPHLATHPAVRLHQGDVRTFQFPVGSFNYFIHASAESDVELVRADPILLFDTHAQGARRVFEFARQCGAKALLFTSSGAVYGRQPPELQCLSETYTGGPDSLDPDSVKAANAGGIRCAELLAALYARQYALPVKLARCFTLIGPYLPLTKPFAATSLLKDALDGGPLQVGGDGTAVRSYLYAADLVIWLWTILLNGEAGEAYNVGSEDPVSISELAREVARVVSPGAEIRIGKGSVAGSAPERYVPSTEKARTRLGLKQWISLPDAIDRTAAWHRQQK